MTQTNVLAVAPPLHLDDVRGEALAQTLREDLQLPVTAARLASLYTIHAPLSAADLEEARQTPVY